MVYKSVKYIFGDDALSSISEYVSSFKAKKVMIVSNAPQKFIESMKERLSSSNIGFIEYSAESNPSFECINNGIELCKENNCDVVIGIGGGSAIDTAKCVSILVTHKGDVGEYLSKEKEFSNESLPFIAIPTTAGTGAEVTKWATVWDYKNMKKCSLSDEKMFANLAIIDPSLTIGLPKYITAYSGIDALSQAIEAYWSKNSNTTSDGYALMASKLIMENLKQTWESIGKENEKDYREKMALASLFSGLAFNHTKTTAVHSTSYPITMHYKVPHGEACGLTLPSFLMYNYDDNKNPRMQKKLEYLANSLGFSTVFELSCSIKDLIKEIGLRTKLSQVKKDGKAIDKEGIELIIKEGFTPDRVKHNPRLVTEENLRRLLFSIL